MEPRGGGPGAVRGIEHVTTPRLSPITLGAMAHVGAVSDEQRVDLFRAAIDAGITSLDTAPLYGFGRSERLVGRAIEGQRDRVQVLTKVGLRWGPDARGEVLFETPEATVHKDSRPEQVQREVRESLERLGVERIDLVQVHHPDPLTPLDETFGALADLHREGKVSAIGASNFSVAQLEEARRALEPIGLFSSQERYSLVYRDVEREHVPWALEHGAGLLCYSPLAQGLLAGRLLFGAPLKRGDFRAEDPSFRRSNLARIHRAMREGLDPVASDRGVPLATVALAWLKAQPAVKAVIAGCRDERQLRGLTQALRLELTKTERVRMRAAFEKHRVEPRPSRLERAERLARRGVGKITRLLGR